MKNQVSALAKLNPSQVRSVHRRYANGESQTSLAKRFKVSQPTISNVLRKVVYKSIKETSR
jgi:DNA-binding MarR family transcriptional regulator